MGAEGMTAHPIRIVQLPGRLIVRWNGHTVAGTSRAVILFEASYPGVPYIPKEDVDKTLLERMTHKTRCPFKGEASYYSLVSPGDTARNAVWTYENPFPVAAPIAGFLAFDPRYVVVHRHSIALAIPERAGISARSTSISKLAPEAE